MGTDRYQRLKERLKQAGKKKSGIGMDLDESEVDETFNAWNPMPNRPRGMTQEVAEEPRVSEVGANLSMDEQVDNVTSIDTSDPSNKHSSTIRSIMRAKRPTPMLVLALYALYEYMTAASTFDDIVHLLFKRRILFHRAVLSLFKRTGLLLSATVLSTLLASLFAWVIDDENTAAVTATAAIGGMFIIFMNVQFAFYIFTCTQVNYRYT